MGLTLKLHDLERTFARFRDHAYHCSLPLTPTCGTRDGGGTLPLHTAEVLDMLEDETEEQMDMIDEPMCEGSDDDLGFDVESGEDNR